MRWILGVLGALAIAGGQAQAANWKPQLPEPVQIPAMAPDAKPQSVAFAQAVSQVPDGQVWAAWGNGLLCDSFVRGTLRWDVGAFGVDNERFEQMFNAQVNAAGFRAPENNLFGEKDVSSRFRVAFAIKDVRARICSFSAVYTKPVGPFRGSMVMTGEWQVYDTLKREVVARIATKVGGVQSEFAPDGVVLIFRAAFRESTRALLANEEFRRIVLTGATTEPAAVDTAALTPLVLNAASAPAQRPLSDAAGSVVAVFAGASLGSAFLVSDDGYLITNHHVVGDAKQVKIRWSDGFETVGDVVRSDKRRDVALIKTEPHGRRPLHLRRGLLQAGETVYAIGTPLDELLQGTVTKGVVSANRIIEGLNFIQSDVAIDHGNSGGPLLNEKGEVVGISEMRFEPGGVSHDLNFFIPIGDALDFLALKPQS